MITNPSTTNKVYVLSGIAPIRKDASDTAEMVTQALLGETLSVHESVERWHRVTCDFDGYEGWISVAQVVFFRHRSRLSGLDIPSGATPLTVFHLPDYPWEKQADCTGGRTHCVQRL